MNPLGVVMAGGRNVRYGGLKAFAQVGETRIIDRVIAALQSVASDVVVIANDSSAYASLGLPIRGDDVATGAALAGLLTALRWSAERGKDGIAVVACDMPFACAELMRDLLGKAETTGADVVVPASGGRRGVEPLFAIYSNRCITAIEHAMMRDDMRMIGFYDDVRVETVALDEVRRHGDPAVLFMNVNTPQDLEAARATAGEYDA